MFLLYTQPIDTIGMTAVDIDTLQKHLDGMNLPYAVFDKIVAKTNEVFNIKYRDEVKATREASQLKRRTQREGDECRVGRYVYSSSVVAAAVRYAVRVTRKNISNHAKSLANKVKTIGIGQIDVSRQDEGLSCVALNEALQEIRSGLPSNQKSQFDDLFFEERTSTNYVRKHRLRKRIAAELQRRGFDPPRPQKHRGKRKKTRRSVATIVSQPETEQWSSTISCDSEVTDHGA